MVLAFAGRRPGGTSFPEDAVEAVGRSIGATLARLAPRRAVGSAAAGSDLLVVEAALRTGARVDVVLAGDRERFRATSVADKGAGWGERFDALLGDGAVDVTEVDRHADDDASYRAVTEAIAATAERLAEPGEEIALLAVSRPRGSGVDHTEELVALARARGWPVWRIDPVSPERDRS